MFVIKTAGAVGIALAALFLPAAAQAAGFSAGPDASSARAAPADPAAIFEEVRHGPPHIRYSRPGPHPGYRPHRPGYHPGYRPRPPAYRPGYRPGRWVRPGRYYWRPGAAVAAGAAIGFIGAATAAAWAGPAPAPGMCWYYTDRSRRQGFWDYCP